MRVTFAAKNFLILEFSEKLEQKQNGGDAKSFTSRKLNILGPIRIEDIFFSISQRSRDLMKEPPIENGKEMGCTDAPK